MTTPPGPVTVHGPEVLRLATILLQRMRRERPDATIWEAADVQWWSRQDRPTDRDGQLFWLDERGEPAAAALATDFGHSVQHDALIRLEDPFYATVIWRTAITRASRNSGAGHEFPVHPADTTGAAELTTEQAHQNRGIASHILATGLSRLAANGCRRLKVSNDLGIYLRAGFGPDPAATAPVWTRPAAG